MPNANGIHAAIHEKYSRHYYLNLVLQLTDRTGLWLTKRVSRVLQFSTAGLLGLIPLSDPKDQWLSAISRPTADFIWSHRFDFALWSIGIGLLAWALEWALNKIFPTGSVVDLEKVQKVLDEVCLAHFGRPTSDQITYRATLFKVRTIWFAGMWLGIVARSGNLYRRHDTVFSISTEDSAHCTGFVGLCWWRANQGSGEHAVYRLPDPNTGDQKDMLQYRLDGHLTDKEYEMTKVKSRVFRVCVIRCKGRVWGVLALDSNDANSIPDLDPSAEPQSAEGKLLVQRYNQQLQGITVAAEKLTLIIE